jgi:amino acid transporter
MKLLKIIGHPVLVMSMFLLVLISGQALGGPYMLYLILGLPQGADYAVTGVIGLICLFVSYKIYRGENKHWIKPVLGLFGILLLLFSLYIFFYKDKMRYNYNTFEQSVPIISLALLAICIVSGLVLYLLQLFDLLKKDVEPPVDSLNKA